MVLDYKLKWNYYNSKLTQLDIKYKSKIYKEVLINEIRFIIIKYIKNNNEIKYRCKIWTGKRWCSFAIENNPRKALNRIKELAYSI